MLRVIKKIKNIGLTKTTKLIFNVFFSRCIPLLHRLRWSLVIRKKSFSGVNSEKKIPELVVSFTTYPKRIKSIYLVVQSLLMQTMKPDRLILWLAEEQFPGKESCLPDDLLNLTKYGLEIRWCRDLKSYKKLIPTLIAFPDSVVITVDDDLYYHPQMVERLYCEYKKNPSVIHCHRASKILISDEGFYSAIPGGYDVYHKPTYLHKLTGCSGVCYPPHSLMDDVTNEALFMSLAPNNDDVWFWLMAALKGFRCNVIPRNIAFLWFVKDSQKDALNYNNDRGEKRLWREFQNCLNYYPDLKRILFEEQVFVK